MKSRKFFKLTISIFLAIMVVMGTACAPTGSLRTVGADSDAKITLYGDIIGLSLYCDGLIVEEAVGVDTVDGPKNTTAHSNIRKGDLLVAIERCKISSATDVSKMLEQLQDARVVQVTMLRNGTKINTKIQPAIDRESGLKKLGLWTRSHVSGIGTLTYSLDSGRFGALGHGVAEKGTYFPVLNGDIFPAEILGVQRGTDGTAGNIQGTFSYQANPLGTITNNGLSGINGVFYQAKNGINVPFGGKAKAHAGKAQLISSINGSRQTYDIEIIRTKQQTSVAEKSMVLRVTDSDLLAYSGGIVQGMSGSPIIQDGYWIGAVTHVFNNSPSEGYAIYADWMM